MQQWLGSHKGPRLRHFPEEPRSLARGGFTREVLNRVGADGVGVKFPIFQVNCSCLLSSWENEEKSEEKRTKTTKKRRKTKHIEHKRTKTKQSERKMKKSEEKRRKAKKSEEKRRKKKKIGKIPPTPSTPTPLRTSQFTGKRLTWKLRSSPVRPQIVKVARLQSAEFFWASRACKPWSANRELRGWQRRGRSKTGDKSGLKKAHKPWIWGKNSAQSVSSARPKPWSANRECGTFTLWA